MVKAKCKHGEFSAYFKGAKTASAQQKNAVFAFSTDKAQKYMKAATYPALARSVVAEDEAERFNLDRTYAALSDATEEAELEANPQA